MAQETSHPATASSHLSNIITTINSSDSEFPNAKQKQLLRAVAYPGGGAKGAIAPPKISEFILPECVFHNETQ